MSVASLPMPPSVIPEISPTVSTAVTMNMMQIGMIALISNTSGTGISFGTENHGALATLSHASTQDFVISAAAPVAASVYVKVVGRIIAITPATI